MDITKYNEVSDVTTEQYFKNNKFAVNMFNSKYAQIKEDVTKEQAPDVFNRIASELSDNEESKNIMFTLLYNNWFRPGGSIISGVNSGKKESLMNCFSEDTEFITSLGVKSFSDFEDGDSVRVLSPSGAFKNATMKKFGKQKLCEVTFRRNAFKTKVKCTEDHLWRTKKSELKKTRDLYVHSNKRHNKSDRFPLAKKRVGVGQNNSRPFCPIGFVHGLVFGDGNIVKNKNHSVLCLRGDSIQFKKFFDTEIWNVTDMGDAVNINILPNYMKSFPDFDNINDEYILGFFIGWFAADGSIDKDGRCELSCAKEKYLKIISEQLQRIGIYTSNPRLVRDESPFDGNKDHKSFNLYIWKDCIFESMFVKDNHKKRYKAWIDNQQYTKSGDWIVESIEYLNVVEDVWCIEEPETHMFTLKYGIPTHNCTTLPIEGDTLEDISKTDYGLMKCAAYRQGIGIELGQLRPRGSKLGNSAKESTGVVPWGQKFNNVGNYVGQQGRRPALLLSLSIDHPDIKEFVLSKSKSGEIEDANISVQIKDDFMECLKNNEQWTLYFKTDREEIKKEVDPHELIELISKTANNTAEPGIQYIDTMRKKSMVHAIYKTTGDERFRVLSTNACSEKFLPAYSVCNLGSINMETFSSKPEQYKKELNEIVPYIVELQDNVIQYELNSNNSPLEQQKWILEQTREIGLGITNLHGWLLKQDIQYDSDEAIEKTEQFMKYYAYCVFKSSIELSKNKGNAPAFEKITTKELYNNSTYFKTMVDEFYGGDPTKITHMRNMSHLSIAPAGSLSNSFSMPCISSGIEPIIAPYYWRKTRAMTKGIYEYYFVLHERVKQYILKQMDKNTDDYNELSKFSGSELDNNGEIGKRIVGIIMKYISAVFFKPAHEIDYNKKIELMGKLYKWIDASISCTFNLPKTSTKDDVKKIYLDAYEHGIGGVSVYREGSREGILIFEDPQKHKAEQDRKTTICQDRPETIQYHCAPRRPKELDCEIHHTTVKGEKWLVVMGIYNNAPYELFAGEQEDLYLPKSVISGVIKKNGGGKYSLLVTIRNNEVEYKNIADTLMTSEQKAITRMISISLRHGVPVEFITTQMKKAKKDITDFASAVSRILGKYVTEGSASTEKCELCGGEMVKTDGCLSCIDCKSSSCG